MTMIELQVNEATLAEVQDEADRLKASLETLIQALIEQLVTIKVGDATLLSLMAQDPGFMKDVATFALKQRGYDEVKAGADPILTLGTEPIMLDVTDASENHDAYLYTL